METWIENLSNPFVLVGFVVFILAAVIVKKGSLQTKGNNSPIINSGGAVDYSVNTSTKQKKNGSEN